MTASPSGPSVGGVDLGGVTLNGVDPLPTGPEGLLCSARGCRQPAVTDLRWNNPKIHVDSRRKHWLACADHETSLGDHLAARGFLREALPL